MAGIAATALSFSIAALGLAAFLYMRVDKIERKLKDFDVIPEDFSSES